MSTESEDYEITPKKMKYEWSKNYSSTAMQIMNKMGYKGDRGLGKQCQGRLEPIKTSQQSGRRGFGLPIGEVQPSDVIWDMKIEDIFIPEKLEWLSDNLPYVEISHHIFNDSVVWGPKLENVKEETDFCDKDILANILHSKTAFDELNESDIRRAKIRCNQFESIRSSIFLNRAAVKMANIDSLCGFMFTQPSGEDGIGLVQDNELLYFADICAGPGGFSEYVLYKKSWEAKGFGFTLKGQNDFKLDCFFAGHPETFDPCYGVKDDGNIIDPENQESFADYVLKQTKVGVHFVMADGGFSVEGRENMQELLSKQLYLCQCLVALNILREKGHFVCKFFDVYTKFSIGLIYLMYKCFKQISICKPNTSRPANSERYLICKWKKLNTNRVHRYLSDVNRKICQGCSSEEDILEIYPYSLIIKDKKFLKYVIHTNNELGRRQLVGLKKILAFHRNADLKETRQSEIRKKCLELWGLPDIMRQTPETKNAENLLSEILGTDWYACKDFLSVKPIELLSKESLSHYIKSIYDWYFVPIGRSDANRTTHIFLCRSRGNLLVYTFAKKWELLEEQFEISPQSLFFGEIVNEYIGEGRNQRQITALHIIDGVMLGGKDIRRLNIQERFKMCKKFAEGLNKEFRTERQKRFGPIRCKNLFKMIELPKFFNTMRHYSLKMGTPRLGVHIHLENETSERFYVPGGILFLCGISHNFYSMKSKSRGILYYVDNVNLETFYLDFMPKNMRSIYASFRNSFSRRLQWNWINIFQVEENATNDTGGSDLLFRSDIREFIHNHI